MLDTKGRFKIKIVINWKRKKENKIYNQRHVHVITPSNNNSIIPIMILSPIAFKQYIIWLIILPSYPIPMFATIFL